MEEAKSPNRGGINSRRTTIAEIRHSSELFNPIRDLLAAANKPLLSKSQDVSFASRMTDCLNHWSYTTFMTLLTIYALFGDDLRLALTSKPADDVFYGFTTACLFFFSVEIILSSIFKEGYWLSFFFWLDVVSTLSLVTDIGWIWNKMVGTSSISKGAKVARAGRASRAGTRAARIIRVIRVIRLIRVAKLYKAAKSNMINKDKEDKGKLKRARVIFRGNQVADIKQFVVSAQAPVEIDSSDSSNNASASQSFSSMSPQDLNGTPSNGEESREEIVSDREEADIADLKIPEESKIGKKLSELTTKRIIILVLSVMIMLPFFSTTFYNESNASYEYGLEVINDLIGTSGFDLAFEDYVSEHEDLYTPLIFLEVNNLRNWSSSVSVDDLRSTEQLTVTLSGVPSDYNYSSYSVFDLRSSSKLEAELNIVKTVFICLILSVSAIFLSKDAQDLVLEPLENMMQTVKNISKNPLKAAQIAESDEFLMEEMAHDDIVGQKKKIKSSMEAEFLKETINKVTMLLALGFGEAGSEIIASNMQKGGGEVDPMIAGKKTYCIFGFCDIRNFTDTTEVLEENVMAFVNDIAHIVHGYVDYFAGCANKNIGDAFLLVWKINDENMLKEAEKDTLARKNPFVRELADMAVISFLKIIAEIHRNPKVLKYREHQMLNERLPGYSVKMGFGLHLGWAIEGAIGSEFKIDASYLSPNVNLASRLEAATKQFGVPILISDALWRLCSQVTRSKLRKIDRVTVKGSKEPIELYTCDIDINHLKPRPENDTETAEGMKKSRIMARLRKQAFRKRLINDGYHAYQLFNDDEDLLMMRSSVSHKFAKTFGKALKNYLDGDWDKAIEGFNKAQFIKKTPDGPCRALLEFMEQEGGRAPDFWPGYRELHDK
ncbi:unnamed protein product [Blepharisma stoltei]|uniref:Guanylate cyclase domain-containing protein n=1 Tax=Blepharisma stoltei TaxID=1481888 RepID=A0AAU9JB17_9CILI|nr:unnamed protein product [Blepharisma stoltei]